MNATAAGPTAAPAASARAATEAVVGDATASSAALMMILSISTRDSPMSRSRI
jgi:hypothetical protein